MSETERYAPFWIEVLLCLLLPMAMLAGVLCVLTEEFLILIVMLAMVSLFAPVAIWHIYKEYKSRLGIKWVFGFLLILFANFMTEWIWVKLCLVLLGGGLMLYDIASKRSLSDAELGE